MYGWVQCDAVLGLFKCSRRDLGGNLMVGLVRALAVWFGFPIATQYYHPLKTPSASKMCYFQVLHCTPLTLIAGTKMFSGRGPSMKCNWILACSVENCKF
jgi:hypothetical protein